MTTLNVKGENGKMKLENPRSGFFRNLKILGCAFVLGCPLLACGAAVGHILACQTGRAAGDSTSFLSCAALIMFALCVVFGCGALSVVFDRGAVLPGQNKAPDGEFPF